LKRLISHYFQSQKPRRQLGFFSHPCRRKKIGVAQFVPALAEVLHLDPAFFYKRPEAEIDRIKPHALILGQRALTER
jgi:hypothetical protein